MTFNPESLIGIPNIMDVYRSGNVAIVNAPGNGVADDKGIYYFVPKMIRYYLDQEPVLKNAPTYLPFYDEDRKYVLDNLEKLVIKDVAEAGGYGVIFGNELSSEKLSEMKRLIEKESRRFIAQEVVDFQDMEVMEGEDRVLRKADLRREEDLKIHGYYLNGKSRSSVLARTLYRESLYNTSDVLSYL